jgi:uncharacterized protein
VKPGLPQHRLTERAFGRLAESATARPRWVVAVSLVLAAAALALAAFRLDLKTSNLDLVDPDLPVVARFRDFAQSFGTPNMLVVVLQSRQPDRLRAAADRTAAAIRGAHGVRAVFARLPYDPATLPFGADPYFTSKDRTMYFLFVQPADPESSASTIAPFVQAVRERVAAAHPEADGVHAGLTGLPQYALDDRDIIRRDTSRLSALSFLLVLALFAAGFAEIIRPILASAALAVTAAVILGFAAVLPGHLTLVSATFFSSLFGLGIDYGIYVADRFEELLADGLARRDAIVRAVRDLGPGLLTGTITSAVAFYAMTLSGFRGFAELGVIGGTGLLVALFFMTWLLPALLMLAGGGGRRGKRRLTERGKRRLPERRERRLTERRAGRFLASMQHPALAAALALAAVGGLALGLPPFDEDYLNLQPRGSEAVRLEREMVRSSTYSPQFAAFLVASPDAARAVSEKLRKLETVGAVRSSADLALLDAFARPIPAEREAFRAAFEGRDGRLAVYAYPAGDVWDPAFQAKFLGQMKAIDPAVTGMPVLGHYMIDRSKRALLITAVVSALAVILLIAADLRHPAWCALALLPTVLGVAGMLGAMRVFGIPFNPLNVMALPVILGTAEDNGVHMVHRFIQEKGDLFRTLAGTGRAVLLCALTTIVGFVSLAFTSHRGLASFALTLTFGITFALLSSLFVLPPLLRFAGPRLGVGQPAREEQAR